MIVEIPDQVISQSGLSSKEILLKVALVLFQEERLTLGQASKLAGLHQFEFQKELAKRDIAVHYGEKDFERDLQTIKQTDNSISATVKLDTASTFCIFQRFYADLLGIEVKSGEREIIRTAKGSFTAFEHEIIIKFSNLEWEAFVYFAQDASFPVSVLGRNGFLNKINIAIIDYEQLLLQDDTGDENRYSIN